MTPPSSGDPGAPRGRAYQQRFDDLAAQGVDVHGEADLVEHLLGGAAGAGPRVRVLDAGCGTGRVGIELARRGYGVEGVDLDPVMLAEARRRAPDIAWHQADLADLTLPHRFDAVVLAGNVLVFVRPGTEAGVVSRCAELLRPAGIMVTGFQVRAGGYGPPDLDRDAASAGLRLEQRWSTWDRQDWTPGGGYQVAVHRRPTTG